MAGNLFRAAVASNKPLQIFGTINAYCALQAEHAGAKALYLSGSGVATASYGLPDLGITDMNDVLVDVRRITRVTKLPLLVDIDTGFGSAFCISRTVQEMEKAGAAGVHIEDQAQAKRCGHRPNKQIVSEQEMVDRIKAAVEGRMNESFVIMARTDALATEGMQSVISRSKAYIAAGADMLFPEAFTSLDQYREYCAAMGQIPVLANITEFGKTPLFNKGELSSCGVAMVLYPLTAFRAMAHAAQTVYASVIRDGHQQNVVPLMQTRADLYKTINYDYYEGTLDRLFEKEAK